MKMLNALMKTTGFMENQVIQYHFGIKGYNKKSKYGQEQAIKNSLRESFEKTLKEGKLNKRMEYFLIIEPQLKDAILKDDKRSDLFYGSFLVPSFNGHKKKVERLSNEERERMDKILTPDPKRKEKVIKKMKKYNDKKSGNGNGRRDVA